MIRLDQDFDGETIGREVLFPDTESLRRANAAAQKFMRLPNTLGERIWGPMMRTCGPPIYTELELLIEATRKHAANNAVDQLLKACVSLSDYRIKQMVRPARSEVKS